MPSVLGSLTVNAVAASGGQTVTVTPKAASGNANRYKITAASAKPVVSYGTVCTTTDGWINFPANGKVTGIAGQVITVVEADASDKAVKKGEAVLPTPTA